MSDTAKPCPFCQETSVTCAETSTYRWGAASCNHCGAVGPEIRKDYTETVEQWAPRAIAEWNERVAPKPPGPAV